MADPARADKPPTTARTSAMNFHIRTDLIYEPPPSGCGTEPTVASQSIPIAFSHTEAHRPCAETLLTAPPPRRPLRPDL